MAEMMEQGGGAHGKKGGPKAKKKSTRIDMTAMVDVAFLLLTFFVLTSTMSKPSMMVLSVPPKREDTASTKLEMKESKFLTLILGKKDKVHYYMGITDAEVKTTNFGDDGVRKLIRNHLGKGAVKGLPNCVGKETANCWDPIIVIKPAKTARYRNLVDILDEMKISAVPKYALTEMTANDSILLVKYAKE